MKHPPTAQELRDFIESAGLNGHTTAELLRVSRRSVGHWMSGKAIIPYSAWYTLQAKVRENQL